MPPGRAVPRRRAPARGAVGAARRQRRRHRPGAGAAGDRPRGGRAVRRPPPLASAAARRRPARRDLGRARRATSNRPARAARFVPVGVGGDSLALQGFDPEIGGNGFMITGPPRSGKSTALHFMLSQPRRGAVTAFVPAPVSAAGGHPPRGHRASTAPSRSTRSVAHLDKARGDQVVAVDDYEVIGSDSPLGQLLAERFARMRDRAAR